MAACPRFAPICSHEHARQPMCHPGGYIWGGLPQAFVRWRKRDLAFLLLLSLLERGGRQFSSLLAGGSPVVRGTL